MIVTVTYPTHYLEPVGSMTWAAVLPVTSPGTYGYVSAWAQVDLDPTAAEVPRVGTDGTCCLPSYATSRTPSYSLTQQTGSTDLEDIRGWLYTLVPSYLQQDLGQTKLLYPNDISSVWTHQSLDIPYTGCMYTACISRLRYPPLAVAASGVDSYANILATSTTTISSQVTPNASPAGKTLPLPLPKQSSVHDSSAKKDSTQTTQTSSVQIWGPWSSSSKSVSAATPTPDTMTLYSHDSSHYIVSSATSSHTPDPGSSVTSTSGSQISAIAYTFPSRQTNIPTAASPSFLSQVSDWLTLLDSRPILSAAVSSGSITRILESSSGHSISDQTISLGLKSSQTDNNSPASSDGPNLGPEGGLLQIPSDFMTWESE
ncbi:hypothetical protein EV356DRAFT_581613 [Viridothelium virens]|uniref:Uncharacterized protein n=1 Tax=Viridothelium virens TaxID=1048519 RepID=A0A6A6GSS5_VIRVR|nr:hypothetical protein EV356DRAFT_581613 [Viridothelium virens]